MSASNDDHGGDDDHNENDREENEDGTGVDMNRIDIFSLQKWNSLKPYHKRRSVRDKNDKKMKQNWKAWPPNFPAPMQALPPPAPPKVTWNPST